MVVGAGGVLERGVQSMGRGQLLITSSHNCMCYEGASMGSFKVDP